MIDRRSSAETMNMSNLICADHCNWLNSEDDTKTHLFYSRDALMDVLITYGCDEDHAYSIAEYVRKEKRQRIILKLRNN